MYEGSCLCGGIRYRLDAEISELACCHCQQCRKAQGTAFASNAPVPRSAFRLISGEELLKSYESSPGKQRIFCGRCGSPLWSERATAPAVIRLRVGSLDTSLQHAPDYHIHAASKAPWYEIRDLAPQYPGDRQV